MSAQSSPEDVVRKFFDCYTNGRPEDFDIANEKYQQLKTQLGLPE